MSIQTELARLTNAKAAIKAAIEGKGVTVPDGTLLDGMAAMIEAIEAGGGRKIACGTITIASTIEIAEGILITHNLGCIPTCGFLIANPYSKNDIDKSETIVYGGCFIDGRYQQHFACNSSYYGPYYGSGSWVYRSNREVTYSKSQAVFTSKSEAFCNTTKDSICYAQGTGASIIKFYAGWEYFWIMLE